MTNPWRELQITPGHEDPTIMARAINELRAELYDTHMELISLKYDKKWVITYGLITVNMLWTLYLLFIA